jgi:polyphosphate kinase 2 (PPK2 family)
MRHRRQGTIILKFFLHLSRMEQKKRFMERLD